MDDPKFEDTLAIDEGIPKFEDTVDLEVSTAPKFEDTLPAVDLSQEDQFQARRADLQKQQEAALQEEARIQKIQEAANDPANWSSTRFKKEMPKPQTMEEQAVYDATLAAKEAKEQQATNKLLPPELQSQSKEIQGSFIESAKPVPIIESLRESIANGMKSGPVGAIPKQALGKIAELDEDVGKAGAVYYISQGSGIPINEVRNHFDQMAREYSKAAGIKTELSNEEFINMAMTGAMVFPVVEAAIAPIQIAKAIFPKMIKTALTFGATEVATRTAILPAARVVYQVLNKEPVKYEVTSLRDLMPESLKDFGTISEFVINGYAAHGIGKALADPRVAGELAGIRFRILRALGVKQETALTPLTSEQIIKGFGGDVAKAAHHSDKVFREAWDKSRKLDPNRKTSSEVNPSEPVEIPKFDETAPVSEKVKPEKTRIKAAPKLTYEQKEALSMIRGDIAGMEAFRRAPIIDPETRETVGWTKTGDIMPYLQNAGIVKDEYLRIIDKALNDKPITEKQRDKIIDVLDRWYAEQEKIYAEEVERPDTQAIPESEQTEIIRGADQVEPGEEHPPDVADVGPGESVKEKSQEYIPGSEKPTYKKPEFGAPRTIPEQSTEATPLESAASESKQGKLKFFNPENLKPLNSNQFQVKLETESKTKKRINKSKILNWVEQAFKVPIRAKITYAMKKAAGFYKTRDELIRLKKWGELEVVTHEVAHHIDKKMEQDFGKLWMWSDAKKGFKKAIIKELADLDYDPNQRRTDEGFAEFIRHYTTGTGQSKALAPNFYDYWNNIISKKSPEFYSNVEKMKDLYSVWKNQGSVARVLGHIDFSGEHLKQSVSKKLETLLDWIRSKWGNELYVLEKMESELGIKPRINVAPTQSVSEMATYMKQKSSGIARHFVTKAAVDEYGNVVGKSLVDILKPIVKGKDILEIIKPGFMRSLERTSIGNFIAYWVSRRAIDLGARGIESGFDVNDAQEIVAKFQSPEFDAAVKELNEWSENLLDWVIRAGGMNEETADVFRAMNPVYAPFKRIFIDNSPQGAGKLFSRSLGIWKIKGSGRPIVNPLESLIKSSAEMISKAHKIRMSNLVADLAKKEGAGKWITEIPLATTGQKVNVKQVLERIFRQLAQEGQEVPDDLSNIDDFMTMFHKTPKYNGKENVVSVFRNGKLKLYEVHPEIFNAFQAVDPIQLNALAKILSPFTRLLRLGATGLNAVFGLGRNPIKDFLTATVFSKHKTYTPLDPFKGIFSEMTAKPGSPAYKFLAAGGDISSQMGYDRAQTMALFDEVLLESLGKKGKVLMIAKHPIDTLRSLVNIPEMGPRIAELEKSMAKYNKEHPSWSDEDVFVAAFNDAQDITINFSRSGKYGKQVNQAVFAFNASIQGLNKFYRAMSSNPVKTTVNGLLWLTLPSIALWYYNKDKEWYKNLVPEYKYNNLFTELSDGTVVRVPIPYDIGTVFSSTPVALLDAYYNQDPKAFKGLIDIAKSQVPNPLKISAIDPIWSVAQNKNFLNVPIETPSMKRLPSVDRKNDYTAPYASYLSKGFNALGMELSPVQIEYLVNGYTGSILKQVGGKEIKQKADIPFIGSFVQRDPERPARQTEEHFRRLEELRQLNASDKLKGVDKKEYKVMEKQQRTFIGPIIKKIKEAGAKKDAEKKKKLNKLLAKRLNKIAVFRKKLNNSHTRHNDNAVGRKSDQ